MKIWNEIDEDAFNYFKWFSRDEIYQKYGYLPNISVFSINGAHCTDKNSRTTFLIEAVKAINGLFQNNSCLQEYTFYLVANVEINQSSSVITKHRKVWKNLSSKWSLENYNCGQELEIGFNGNTIFTSIASFGSSELEKSLEIVSSNPKMFTIIASLDTEVMDEKSIKDAFENSFYEERSEIDYFNLTIKHCLANNIVFRFGDASEEIEIALIFKSELIDAFNRCL